MRHLAFVSVLIAVSLTEAAAADTINVPGDAATIQAGIDLAVNGDEVVIADGIYAGTGNVNLNFGGRLITVRSASGDPTLCMIDGGFANGGFTFNSGETNAAVVDGLTIAGCQFGPPSVGAAFLIQAADPTINNCILNGNFTGLDGGAIHCDDASPIITNCTFQNNFAIGNGGAIHNTNTSTPAISSCNFQGNTALGNAGAIYNDSSAPTISNSGFTNNSSNNGGAIFVHSGEATITGCGLKGNTALTNAGGGIAIIASGQHTIEGCTFESNCAALAGGGIDYSPEEGEGVNSLTVCDTFFAGNFTSPEFVGVGGAISNTKGTLLLELCTFDTNTATSEGGGIYTAGGLVMLTGCVLGGNSAPDLGGGIAGEIDDLKLGAALTLADCVLFGNQSEFGGGIHITLGTMSMTTCTLAQNIAMERGGGVFAGSITDSSLDGCTFSENSAHLGGGMYNLTSSPMMTNCVFSRNMASFGGGGLSNEVDSHATVANCTFTDNSAVGDGGGMYNYSSSFPVVTNCVFRGNMAGGEGGGMFNSLQGNPTVTDCTFIGNTADDNGGGVANGGTDPTITNCTFVGNSAGMTGGGIFTKSGGNPTTTNCILWGGSPDQIFDTAGTPILTYSNIQGGVTGTGNIDADPLFVDPDGLDGDPDNDFHLGVGSPSIDAADNDAPGLAGITEDFDGNPRFVDDPDTTDTGNGSAPIIDMGAYEFQVANNCPADLNGDGFVNAADLAILLGAWGPCVGCSADLTGDDQVNAADLATLLGAWGPCP